VLQVVLEASQVWWSVRAPRVGLLACAFSTGALGCLPPQSGARVAADELQVMGGVPGAVVDLSPIEWKPGISATELPVAGQGKRSAMVWIPEAAAPRALLVLLHGAVRAAPNVRGGDPLAPSRTLLGCLAAPALAFLQPLIIAPRSPAGQWWTRSDTEYVLGLVLATRSRWPEAGAHSVILGYSNGGIGTWYFARLYPEYFSAAVPMAFNATVVGASSLPIYAIQGTKDEQFEFPPVRAALQSLIQQGRDVTLDEKYRGSHYAMCDYVPELTRAGHWLEQRVLSRRESSRVP
jgi:hypothetical protein